MVSLLQKFLQQSTQEYLGMKLGLERIQQVLAKLGNPETAYPSVLIAGTNGKGSVARMLESVLLRAGHRVGLYTSPHLVNFTERIRVEGEEISEAALEEVLKDLQGKFEDLTWFEKATVLAFEIFRREKIDLAVLEVGLGGRWDATNVVEPLVCAITSIGMDHGEVLGNSLFEIAREKAGVMRRGKPLVLGIMDEGVRTFLVKAARQCGAQPVTPSIPKGSTDSFSYGSYQDLQIGLKGVHQVKNAAVTLEVLHALREKGFQISEKQMREGLAKVSNPGRLEWIEGDPPLLLDGAHNEEALRALVDYVEREARDDLTIVFGMMAEKNFHLAIKILKTLQAKWLFTQVPSSRSLKVSDWKKICSIEKIEGEFFEDPSAALNRARELTPPKGLILVTGSLYLVGALRNFVMR